MDGFKKPEIVISGANALALVALTAYMYKKNTELDDRIITLKGHLSQVTKLVGDLQKQNTVLSQIPGIVKKNQETMALQNKQQRKLGAVVVEQNMFCSAIEKSIVELGGSVSKDFEPMNIGSSRKPKRGPKRGPKTKRRPRRQEYIEESDDDDDDDYQDEDDDYDDDDDIEKLISIVRDASRYGRR